MDVYVKFRLGDWIVPSKLAVEKGVLRREIVGIVVGFGRDSSMSFVRVRHDGSRWVTRYHMDFWDVATNG